LVQRKSCSEKRAIHWSGGHHVKSLHLSTWACLKSLKMCEECFVLQTDNHSNFTPLHIPILWPWCMQK
jgi:hypothetical protein